MELRGKKVLVTGGAHRVGRAMSLALAREGMTVGVHYHAAQDEGEETARMIGESGGEAHLIQADLREAGAPERVVGEAAELMDGLDVLVNSAAVMLRTPFGRVSLEEWNDIFALNLRAPFFAAQAAAAIMRDRGQGGVIVNIADLAAFETWPAYVPHGISKAGVVQLTRALARVLAPTIRVNAIAPGAVLLPDGWTDDEARKISGTTPLRRLGSPGDVTEALLYLLRADFVTGETLVVDGGRHVRC